MMRTLEPQEKKAAPAPAAESDDAMTIIAGLVVKGHTGDAARLGLLWFVAITVQGVLLFCIAAHTWHLSHIEDKTDDEYVKPSCNATISAEDADDNGCLKNWRVKMGFYFAAASFFWYTLQDQYSTSLPTLLALRSASARVSWRWTVLCLVDSLVTWINFAIGMVFLSMTQALQDLILNCTALIFISEIDDILVQIVKRLGFADKYLSQSASLTITQAVSTKGAVTAVSELGGAFFCAACSLPISIGMSMFCFWRFGKQIPNYEDFGILGGMTFLTVCVIGIFMIDSCTEDQNGDGIFFKNMDDAEALSGEEGEEEDEDDYA